MIVAILVSVDGSAWSHQAGAVVYVGHRLVGLSSLVAHVLMCKLGLQVLLLRW